MDLIVKKKIIALVEKSENSVFLEQIYTIMDSNKSDEGELLNFLSAEEKKETYQSLKDMEDPDNVISQDEAMNEIRKKLGWN